MRDYSGAQPGLKQQHYTPWNAILLITLCVLFDEVPDYDVICM
jgi:hypothetical protein